MKTITQFMALLLAIIILCNCKGLPMVKSTKDMKELKINEPKFVDKPLKYLLREVGPEIKTGIGNNEEGHFFFRFKFITLDEQLKNQGKYDDKVSLYVYVKDPIDWHFEKRKKGEETIWTKEDAKKYGNLIVTRIKVINQPKEGY